MFSRYVLIGCALLYCTVLAGLPAIAQQTNDLELNLEQFPEQKTAGEDLELNLEQFEKSGNEKELELNLEQFENNTGQSSESQSQKAPANNTTDSNLDLEKFDQKNAPSVADKPRSLFSGNGLFIFIGAALLLFLIFAMRRRR